jgi:hypothetical protein
MNYLGLERFKYHSSQKYDEYEHGDLEPDGGLDSSFHFAEAGVTTRARAVFPFQFLNLRMQSVSPCPQQKKVRLIGMPYSFQ